MLALALALASQATDVSWTDHSGQCPASRGHAAVEAAAETFDSASIKVEVEATDDGLTATLLLETPNGTQTRTLRSPACDTLVEATVLITRAAAMAAIVPEPPAEPQPSEPEPDSVAQPALEPEPEPVPHVVAASLAKPPAIEPRTSPETGSLFASIRAFGFGTLGTTPGFGGGGGLAVGLGSTFWRADVSGLVSAPTTTARQPGVQAWGWAVGAHGCGTFDVLRGRLQPGVCGGVEAGELLGEGTGALENPTTQRGPWVAATVGPTLRAFVVPGLAIVLDVDAVVSVLRPGFRVRDGVLHQPEVVAPRVALGLELHLPRR